MSERELFDATPGFWEADLYDCDDDTERLSHSDPEDAIEEALDRWLDPKCDALETLRERVGETITVYAFKRNVLPENELDPEWLLEQTLEPLDEEWGDPDEGTEITPGMKAAAEAFAAAIRAEYRVWTCDQSAKATVNVEAWVREYRPDWLEPVAAKAGEGA